MPLRPCGKRSGRKLGVVWTLFALPAGGGPTARDEPPQPLGGGLLWDWCYFA